MDKNKNKSLNNLIGYKDFSKQLMDTKNKTTKRTQVAKDILNESHLSNTDEQKDYICRVLDILEDQDIKKVYDFIEGILIEKGIDETEI